VDERLDVMSVVATFALAADTLRWNDLRAILAPEVVLDYTSLWGGEARRTPREDIIAGWRELLPGFTHTAHLIGAVRVVLTEGSAYSEAPVMASHAIQDESLAGNNRWAVGGRYEMQMERHNGQWQISALTLADAWTEGNPGLPEAARQRVREGRGRQSEG